MIRVGLTGSIGMGKSTTAGLFAAAGVPVYDADAAVHALYARGGAAVVAVENAFPGVVQDGAVDRAALSSRVIGAPNALQRLEALVHPLVAADRATFLRTVAAAPVVVLDVPLLFESGGDAEMDAVVVVSCGLQTQRARVLARPAMTLARFETLLARQLPDAEKRARADFVIDTGQGLAAATAQVKEVLDQLHAGDFTSRRSRTIDGARRLDVAPDAPH